MQKLTDAQIYTLRRMGSGRSYIVSTDGRKAMEVRTRYINAGDRLRQVRDDVNAPSIPALIRKGLVVYHVQGDRSYHPAHLTEEARKLLPTLKPSIER